VGFDDDMITNELRGLAHAFTTGAAGSAPPLPLTALVIQVPVHCSVRYFY
jgi:tRNA (uracil-5-)-methyltransferase